MSGYFLRGERWVRCSTVGYAVRRPSTIGECQPTTVIWSATTSQKKCWPMAEAANRYAKNASTNMSVENWGPLIATMCALVLSTEMAYECDL